MSAATVGSILVPPITTQISTTPLNAIQPPDTNAIASALSSNSNGSSSSSYRLLYRGALSLPDSLLLLDGLTFSARLGSPSKQSSFQLLDNPLALALESMRGRPTLRFIGTCNLRDIYMDETGGVEMDIHPSAILSHIYFENTFCLLPFSSAAASSKDVDSKPDRSEIGIRVALGDSDGPETTHMVIFAQVAPLSEDRRTIRLCVGRITQKPLSPQTQKRIPRPDDPIPRKPPAFFITDTKRTDILGRELKRVASGTNLLAVGKPAKKQRLTSGNGVAADLGSGVRLGGTGDREAVDRVFKVPELPKAAKVTSKGKEKEKDVFGDVSEAQQRAHVGNKGKQKADDGSHEATALEKANKNLIKRATMEYLGRTKDPTNPSRVIDKYHSEFKDLYNSIYRGVGFALRAKMRTCAIDSGLVNHLIGMHALMYLGHGGSADGAAG